MRCMGEYANMLDEYANMCKYVKMHDLKCNAMIFTKELKWYVWICKHDKKHDLNIIKLESYLTKGKLKKDLDAIKNKRRI